MVKRAFPLEKIFGSRTRVGVMALFTTGVKRPYYVREIARAVHERLNAVRRELEILRKIGMLSTYVSRRRKYYVLREDFNLLPELSSIMQKAGPGVEDVLFKSIGSVGNIRYVCVSGYFTGAKQSPTDLFIVGDVDSKRLEAFVKRVEAQIDREIVYTPMTENEYRYRLSFKDVFLRSLFSLPYKELVNKLDGRLQPSQVTTADAVTPVPK